MAISAFDLFTIGIGPSSSHTVGPMRAANRFVDKLIEQNLFKNTAVIDVTLYGSLGATGKGHGSDKAIVGGLEGSTPENAVPEKLAERLAEYESSGQAALGSVHQGGAKFVALNFRFTSDFLELHSNALTFTARGNETDEVALLKATYYSVGGGFVIDESSGQLAEDKTELPLSFETGDQLLQKCADSGLSISSLMLKNEQVWHPEGEVNSRLLEIWAAMQKCVETGCQTEGILPGGLKVKRRAAPMYRRLRSEAEEKSSSTTQMDWVNLWALAVNEENAAGGRVVTAPTNGAAGIIPAVLHYFHKYCPGADDAGTVRFLLTSAAIGILFKLNASISGAEVGCQGEVGSACSMAAAGLTEVTGGSPAQVENAAEIAMEHNLGLTCDPIGGLVQVPCIERNAMAAVKAINASRLALRGDGQHFVSLDKVIRTMRETGIDMATKYKETARGGLAVNVVEC